MQNPDRLDPYNEIALRGPQDFELRGSGLAVPLFFKPDAAFILRTVLEQDTDFTRDAIVTAPGFRQVCENTYTLGRFSGVWSDMRFTFDALRSTLIQMPYKQGTTNVYRRNPAYTVTDEVGLLTRLDTRPSPSS